jgi:hypothetical protein
MTGGSTQLPQSGGRSRPWWRRTWVLVTGGILMLFVVVGALGGDPKDPADRAAKAGAAPTATPTPSPTPDAVADARARARDLVQDGDYLAAVRTLQEAGLTGTASRVRARGARALLAEARRALNGERFVVARRVALDSQRLHRTSSVSAVLDQAGAAIAQARAAARERRRQAALARDQRTCTSGEKDTVRADGGVPAGCETFAADLEARRAAQEAEQAAPACDPNYAGACLDPNSEDYDCEGGSGNGPDYTGTVRVVGADPYDLDRDGDGIACDP